MAHEYRPANGATTELMAPRSHRPRISGRLLYVLALLAMLMGTVGMVHTAEAATYPPPKLLGGFLMSKDCKKYFDNSKAVAAPAPFYYAEAGWVCVVNGREIPVTRKMMNAFAVIEYGRRAFARQDGLQHTDWRAYRNAVRLGGFNLTEDCRWYHRDANARAKYTNVNKPKSWYCLSRGVRYPIDLNLFARHEYGKGAFAYLTGPKATDWAAFRY